MKKNLFLFSFVALCGVLTSCNSGNTVSVNYEKIIIAPQETVEVVLSGGLNGSNAFIANIWHHDNDSIFSVSKVTRHKLKVTGQNIGIDTLVINYGAGIYNNGAFIAIPVTCVQE